MAISIHKFKIVSSWKEVKEAVSYCKKTGYCSHDFETNGEPPQLESSYPTILGMSFQPCSAYVIPLGHSESKFKKNYIDILDYIGEHLISNTDVLKIAWNMKFENKWFLKYGWDYRGRCFDGMLAKHLLDEERPNGLGDMVNRIFDDFTDYKDDTQILAKKHGWANIPLEELSKRNALDCDLTLRLMLRFEENLRKNGLYKLFRNLVMPNSNVLARCEYGGYNIDVPYLDGLVKSYARKIDRAEKKVKRLKCVRVYDRARVKSKTKELIKQTKLEIKNLRDQGKLPSDRTIKNREEKISRYIAGEFTTKKEQKTVEPLSLSSSNQMIDFLFKHPKGLNFEVVKYTKDKKTKKFTTRPSTDEEVLDILKTKDTTGFIEKLLYHREINHLNSTYVVGMKEKLLGDKVYTNFLIHGTVTGRLSSKEPNLQNIPRGTTAADIKRMFLPPPGMLILEVDYSQAELRMVAELSGDEAMIDIFRRNYNIHMATACLVNGGIHLYDEGKNAEKDDKHPKHLFWVKQKKRAKTINFGILYGQGPKKLSEELECTPDEAKKFIKMWFSAYPKVEKWIKNQHKTAQRTGEILNIFGRKRRLPEATLGEALAKAENLSGKYFEALRQSVNAPIQGGSSDLTQLSAVEIDERIRAGKLPKMPYLYTVHDSLGFGIYPQDVHKVVPQIVEICSNPNTMKWFGFEMKSVRMKVSPEIGINWGELKEYDNWTDYKSLIKS